MPIQKLDYPQTSCPACQNDTWWYNPVTGTWICGTCHPPFGEKEILKMRIRKGNVVLTQRHREIKLMDGPDKVTAMEGLVEGQNRIRELGRQLANLGCTECLYIVGRNKVKRCIPTYSEVACFTCSNDYWWEKEVTEINDRLAKV